MTVLIVVGKPGLAEWLAATRSVVGAIAAVVRFQ